MRTWTETIELAELGEKTLRNATNLITQTVKLDGHKIGLCKFHQLESTDMTQISNYTLTQIRKQYFRKHVGNFINWIRILQKMYEFPDHPEN